MREAVCGPSTLAVLASTGPGCVAWGSRAAFRMRSARDPAGAPGSCYPLLRAEPAAATAPDAEG
jgi:hypothetical protein